MSAPSQPSELTSRTAGHSFGAAHLLACVNFTRPSVEQTETKIHNESRCDSAAVGAVSGRTVHDEDGSHLLTSRQTSIETERGGKLYNIAPSQLAKAKAHWARKSAQRKQPGNCGRCGKPNPSKTHKHCDDCRDYMKRRREGKAGALVTIHQSAVSRLERRIGALEHSLAMLQLNGRLMYKRGYQRGLKTGKEIRHYHGTPEISKQELATMNHAYDHDQD